MEKSTTSKPPKKASKKANEQVNIQAAYMDYVLQNGKQPLTIYKFCIDLGIKEDEFYKQFASFDALEKNAWKELMDRTIASLEADSNFKTFDTREKFLAFYFTHVEILNSSRSFILFQLKNHNRFDILPNFIKSYKLRFEEFAKAILAEGKSTGQIAERPYLDKLYPQFFWTHLTLLLMFWKDDDTPGFEKTDVFIEKSVNLAFSLVGKGALDSAFDFAKFLYQSKIK